MSLESHVVRTFGDDVVFPPYFFLVNWLNAAMKGDKRYAGASTTVKKEARFQKA